MDAPFFNPADLAPGDIKSRGFDTRGFEVSNVQGRSEPAFSLAYARLWEVFGESGALETQAVLQRRLAWNPGAPQEGLSMLYELLWITCAGEFAAVHDHVVTADASGAVVHLSHMLIAPAWRRTGLGGWIRSLPLQAARRCLVAAALPASTPVTLVAEVEYPDPISGALPIALRAYERAGYLTIDPRAVQYQQPDFRPPAVIDAAGVPTGLPFQLVIRRLGRDEEPTISGAEARWLIERLYRGYAREMRPGDMVERWRHLDHRPAAGSRIALLPPTTAASAGL